MKVLWFGTTFGVYLTIFFQVVWAVNIERWDLYIFFILLGNTKEARRV